MSMAQQELDYTTLRWVKNEIQESLNQTRQALEHFLENPSDETQIRFCTTYLHQVYGTLQMVEIYGAALLAEEMELLASAIMNGKVSQKDDACEALMRAILQLPAYLEHLENGQQDMPVILLPLLNDLRSARGENLLSESAFFSPNLNVNLPAEGIKHSDKEPVDIKLYARKLRPVYQAALVGVYRNKDTEQALKKIAIVFREILQNAQVEDNARLWWIASAIVESLMDGQETNTAIKQLLGHLDRQIKRIISEGEETFSQQPPVELIKNLLYYVATSKSKSERVEQVKKAFELDQLLPGGSTIDEAFANLRGSTAELMQSVSSVIKEDLLAVKDQLDIFVRDPSRGSESLQPLVDQLRKVSDTLAMLGLGDLHKIIQDQGREIDRIVQSGAVPPEASLMEIASALLYVESSLEGVKSARSRKHLPDETAESILPESERKQLSDLVIGEARSVLLKVKDAFNTYAANPEQRRIIEQTPAQLNEIRGVLAILGYRHSAKLVAAVINYIQNRLMDDQAQVSSDALEMLADVITSVEYHLEAIVEDRPQPESILTVAEQSLAKLGYESLEDIEILPISDKDSVSESTSVAALEIEPAAEPEPAEPVEFVAEQEPQAQEEQPAQEQVVQEVTTATSTVSASAMPEDDIDEEILEIFIEEADEVVGVMKDNLQAWRVNNDDNEALTVLRRSYHTIKGSGRLAGAKVVGEFAWSVENMLNRVIDGQLEPRAEVFDLLQQAEGILEECIAYLKGERPANPDVQPVVDMAEAYAVGNFDIAANAAANEQDVVDEIEPEGLLGVDDGLSVIEEPLEEDMISFEAETSEPELEDEHQISFEVEQEPESDNVINIGDLSLADDATLDAGGLELEELKPEDVGEQGAGLMEGLQADTVEEPEEVSPEDQLAEIFRKETSSHIQSIKDYIAQYDDSQPNKVSDALNRALHTLHGSAHMAGVQDIAELAEPFDRFVRFLYDNKQLVDSDALDVINECVAMVESMVESFRDPDYASPDASDLIRRVKALHEEAMEYDSPAAEPIDDSIEFSMEEPGDTVEISVSGDIEDDESDELKGIFLDEAEEILHNIEALMQGWSDAVDDVSIMSELQRALHTLKGGARMSGITEVADLSHSLESLLEKIAQGQIETTADLPRLAQKCQDWLSDSVEALRQGADLNSPQHLQLEIEDRIQGNSFGETTEVLESMADFGVQVDDESGAENIVLEEQNDLINIQEEEGFPADDVEEISFDSGIEIGTEDTVEIESLGDFQDSVQADFEPLEEPADDEQSLQLEGEDDELLQIFLEEAEDIQDNSAEILNQWQNDLVNLEYVTQLQRGLHTLKGGARMAGLPVIADLAHAVESLLESISEQSITIRSDLLDLMHNSHDWFARAIEQARQGGEITPALELIEQLKDYKLFAEEEAAQPLEDEGEQITLADESKPVLETIDLDGPDTEEITLESEPETNLGFVDDTNPTIEISSTFDQVPQTEPVEQSSAYDEDLIGIFIEEAEELQETTDALINEWAQNYRDRGSIAQLQRALHTLKGGARMANVTAIGDISHSMESLLEGVTEGRLEPTDQFPRLIQSCHDWLSRGLEDIKQNKILERPDDFIAQLESLATGEAIKLDFSSDKLQAPSQPEPPAEHVPQPKPVAERKAEPPKKPVVQEKPATPARPSELVQLDTFDEQDSEDALPIGQVKAATAGAVRGADEQIRVSADLLDNLVNNAGEVNIYNARINQQLGAWHFNLSEMDQTVSRLHEQIRKFEIETEAQILYRHTDEGTELYEQFDPLELDRFSYMQQLSRGMMESLSDLTNIQDALTNISGETDVLLLQQSRINSDLQQGLMRTRLTPFSSVVPRLRRIVRQTCQETGKDAELKVIGAEGEMDRTQLNRIVPALEHILRNAVDHGMEVPAERKQLNKPATGTIALDFSREGSEIVLQIKDDGAGIDIGALRKKAVERGLMKSDSKVSDKEVLDFILESGFSTAEKVTQISGRGVGMDVVNTEIKQLNGSLNIDTESGKGSQFTVRLPLTVLTNQALMVQVDESTYAIQLSNVEHVVRVTGDELNELISGNKEYFDYAGHQYPLLNIAYVLHGTAIASTSGNARFPLLLARSGEQRVALQVGHLIGRQDIVIKSVGPQLSSINSISGATIMPDGEVALILDLTTLIRTAHAIDAGTFQQPVATVVQKVEAVPTVMVVDDSITVRKITERLLKRHNFNSLLAKDGVDALTIMLEQVPDIMLLDIEMPRMDGYELASTMKNDERLKNVPIIMITSRAGEKHRERALSIGVNMYMSKPFQEHELLENLQNLLKKQQHK